MGISKKNKRKLIFLNQEFYWWVKEEFDGNGGMLEVNIATENKAFLVQYYAIQKQFVNKHITVIGKSFPNLERKNGNWQRFICPNFIPDFTNNGVGPKDVVSILEWCYDTTKDLIAVNYKGERL